MFGMQILKIPRCPHHDGIKRDGSPAYSGHHLRVDIACPDAPFWDQTVSIESIIHIWNQFRSQLAFLAHLRGFYAAQLFRVIPRVRFRSIFGNPQPKNSIQ